MTALALLDSRRLPRFGASMSGRGRPTGSGEGAHVAALLGLPASQVWNPVKGGATCARVRVWKRLLGIHRAVIEGVRLEPDGALVISLRPKARERDRCPHCRRRCSGYKLGEGRRRWRALDVRDELRLPGSRSAQGQLHRARRGGRRGAVGAARLELHPQLRGPGRVADRAHQQDRGLGVDAHRVAIGRLDLPARGRGSSGSARSALGP